MTPPNEPMRTGPRLLGTMMIFTFNHTEQLKYRSLHLEFLNMNNHDVKIWPISLKQRTNSQFHGVSRPFF